MNDEAAGDPSWPLARRGRNGRPDETVGGWTGRSIKQQLGSCHCRPPYRGFGRSGLPLVVAPKEYGGKQRDGKQIAVKSRAYNDSVCWRHPCPPCSVPIPMRFSGVADGWVVCMHASLPRPSTRRCSGLALGLRCVALHSSALPSGSKKGELGEHAAFRLALALAE